MVRPKSRPMAHKTVRKGETSITKDRKRKQSKPIKNLQRTVHSLSRIRMAMNDEEYLIPTAPFVRIVKEILTKIAVSEDYRDEYNFPINLKIQRGALDALKLSAEHYLIQLFEDMNLMSLHAHRKTVMIQDFQIVKRLRQSYGDKTMMDLQSESRRY